MVMPEEKDSKIVSDENWKDEARREKEKLAEESKAKAAEVEEPQEPRGPLPPPDMLGLVNSLALQAMFSLGRLAAPGEEPAAPNFDYAKHHIGMLEVLEEKTKGNLSDEESKALAMAIQEVRMAFVAAAQTP
jgi:hypothetical protein